MHHRVPPAQNVAGGAQHPVPPPATADAAPATADAQDPAGALVCSCPHRPLPCPAVAGLIGPAVASREAETWISRVRPCNSCRVPFEAGRDSLRHLRLGRREREILRGAAAATVHIVTRPGMSRSESAASRRAAQMLARAGLVASAGRSGDSAASAGRAAVMLTELGRYVVAAFGRYLESNKPIRWTRARAGVVLPGRDPSTLGEEALALARVELEATLAQLAAMLVAAVKGGVRDQATLETASRALEIKATGLRSVLAAGGDQARARRAAGLAL